MELEPGAVDVTVDVSIVVVVSAVEGGRANVAEADVDVTGGAIAPVGVMGGEVTVTELNPCAGTVVGLDAVKLDILETLCVDP